MNLNITIDVVTIFIALFQREGGAKALKYVGRPITTTPSTHNDDDDDVNNTTMISQTAR